MNTLILGLIANYTIADVRIFVASLRSVKYEGDTVFFVNNIDDGTIEYLHQSGIETIGYHAPPYENLRGRRKFLYDVYTLFNRNLGITLPFTDYYIGRSWHCQSSRFYFYYRYLARSTCVYDRILITDVSDVVFQRNPFDYEDDFELALFEEYPGISIGQQEYNRVWVESYFGRDVLNQLSGKKIICSGITLGSHAGIARYLAAMMGYFRRMYGYDGKEQAITNYLVHNNQLGDMTVYPFGHGPAMHIGIAPGGEIRSDAEGYVLCDNGTRVNILHQYDRHDALTETISRRYGV